MKRVLTVFVVMAVMAAMVAAMAVPAFAATTGVSGGGTASDQGGISQAAGPGLGCCSVDSVMSQAQDPTYLGAPLGQRVSDQLNSGRTK